MKWFGWLLVVPSQRADLRKLPVSSSSMTHTKEGRLTRNMPPPTNPGVRRRHPSIGLPATAQEDALNPKTPNPKPQTVNFGQPHIWLVGCQSDKATSEAEVRPAVVLEV